MTKKKIARSRPRTKDQPVDAEIRRAAERAGITPQAPNPWKLTGKAFDGGEDLDPEATAADLFSLCFEASNRDYVGGERLLDEVLLCAADDMEIIAAALASSHDVRDPLARFMMRSEWRIKIAREVHRRIQAAEQASGGAS